MRKLIASAILVVLPLCGVAQADFTDAIVNGSFENGNYSPVVNGSYVSLSAGSTNLTGWTIGGVGIDWHQNSFEVQKAFDGQKVVDLNLGGGGLSDTGTLSQSLATTIGEPYLLTFYLAGPNSFFPDPRQVRVDIGGAEQVFSQAASSNLSLDWGKESLLFNATSTVTTLKFSSVDGSGYWGPFLDNVSVVPSAVPEPSSLVILSGGLITLSAFAWRSRGRSTNSTL